MGDFSGKPKEMTYLDKLNWMNTNHPELVHVAYSEMVQNIERQYAQLKKFVPLLTRQWVLNLLDSSTASGEAANKVFKQYERGILTCFEAESKLRAIHCELCEI